MRIQDVLKRIRVSQGLSQIELAEKLNVSNGFISNIESGKKAMPLKIIDYLLNSEEITREEKYFISTLKSTKIKESSDKEEFLKEREKELKKLELEIMRKQYKLNTVNSKYALKGDIREQLIRINSYLDTEIAILEILYGESDNEIKKYFKGSLEVTKNKFYENIKKLTRLQQEEEKVIEIE